MREVKIRQKPTIRRAADKKRKLEPFLVCVSETVKKAMYNTELTMRPAGAIMKAWAETAKRRARRKRVMVINLVII
jgi:hypothetical protein